MAQQGFPDTLQQKLTHAGVYSMKEIILLEELSPFEFDKVAFRFEFTSEDRTVVSKALKAHKAAMIFESPSGKSAKFWSKGASKRTPGAIKNSVIANSPSSMSSELSAENFGRALENSYDAFYEDLWFGLLIARPEALMAYKEPPLRERVVAATKRHHDFYEAFSLSPGDSPTRFIRVL
eukprot:scaffold2657_cov145-Pinguiococcus_pyrenoidosus.AAC.1